MTLTPLYRDEQVCGDGETNSPFENARKDESCSIGVVVSTTGSVLRERQTAMLIATDKTSGRVLRCEVFVDHVASMKIETTTRTLYKDDVEDVQVQAFDEEGNLFSTLDGLSFRWSILPLNVARATNILKFVPFRDVSVDAPDSVYALEEQGKQSARVLVQAMDVGRVNLTAVLEDESGVAVTLKDSVVLSVYYPLVLDPSQTQYVLQGTSVQYTLQTQAKTGLVALPMPDPHYKWEAGNTSVVSVDETGLAKALKLGSAPISAVNMEMSGNRATGRLHVVLPAYVSLEVFLVEASTTSTSSGGGSSPPTHNLIVGREYDVRSYLFEQGGHALSHTAHLDWNMVLPKSWRATRVAANHYRVVPDVAGTASCSASLTKLLKTPLRVEQELFVTDPVRLSPASALLPLDSADGWGQDFHVTGGSGRYNFYSSNRAVVTVDAAGVAQPRSVGTAQVAAVDQTNLQNQDRATVEVAEAASAKFIRSQYEVLRGQDFAVPLEVRDASGRAFTNCSGLKIEWSVGNEALVSEAKAVSSSDLSSFGPTACIIKGFSANALGRTTIHFRYRDMTGETVVRIFDPVAIEGPERVCATIGTSIAIGWRGGPPPGDAKSFFSRLVASSESMSVKIERAELSDGKTGFRVTCLKAHSQKLELRVGHTTTKGNPTPAESVALVHYNCIDSPARILLYPVYERASTNSISSSIDSAAAATRQSQCTRVSVFASLETLLADSSSSLLARYQVTNDEKVSLRVIVMDDAGLVCSNFSSVPLNFESNQGSLVKIVSKNAAASMSLDEFVGNVVVTAKAKSVSSQVEFNVVNPLAVSQSELNLFNDPAELMDMVVSGGSGIYDVVSNKVDQEVVSFGSDESGGSGAFQFAPLRAGVIGIIVRDLCMPGKAPINVNVRVAGLSALKAHSFQSFVPVDNSTAVRLTAFSNFDKPLSTLQMRKYLRVEPRHDDIISMWRTDEGGAEWTVKCLTVGSGSVYFVATTPTGEVVESTSVPIQCFPSLKLFPKVMRLLPAEVYQVRWSGCPSVCDLAFEVSDRRVATVDSSGTILAGSNPGKARLSASCRGVDPAAKNQEEKSVFSTDSVELIVQELGTLRLRCPANALLIGAEMTAHVQGRTGETPITFGTQPVRYRWEAMNPEIASLQSVFASTEDEASFSVRVVGKNAGVTRISAWMTRGDESEISLGNCQLSVVEPLVYENGCRALMLLPPQSRGHIRTSKDSTRVLSYRVFGENSTVVARVDEAGTVTTGNDLGSALVEVADSSSGERLIVEVVSKPLHMLQLIPEHSSFQQQDGTLPIGSEVKVKLILRSANGAAFHATDVAFDYEMNNYDIISLRPGHANGTLILRALRPGKAVLRVFLVDRPELEDFLLVTSGNAISPSQPTVVLGGSLQFSAFVASDGGLASASSPVWSSLNPSTVSIDDASGKAIALRQGKARIMLKEGMVTTFTEVDVIKVQKISVDRPEEPITNVVLLGKGKPVTSRTRVTFQAGPSLQTLRRSKGVQHGISHTCQIVEHMWAFAIAQYDNVTDTHFCAVTALRPRNPKTQAPRALTLEVKSGDVSASSMLPFVSGFSLISDADESVELNVDKRSYLLEILSSNVNDGASLMVSASNPDKLEVTKISETGTITAYNLRAVDSHSFDVQLQLLSPSTGQKQVIPVSYKAPASFNSRSFQPQQQQQQQQQQPAVSVLQQQEPARVVQVESQEDTAPIVVMFSLIALLIVCVVIVVLIWKYLSEAVGPGGSSSSDSVSSPARRGGPGTPNRSGFTPQKAWQQKNNASMNAGTPGTKQPFQDSWASPLEASSWMSTTNNSSGFGNNTTLYDSPRKRR